MIKKLRIILICAFVAACIIPQLLEANNNSTDDAIFQDPMTLVEGLYASVSFEPGTVADWNYVRSFFLPEAVFAMRKTPTLMEVMDLDAFIAWFEDDVKKYKMNERGFEENVKKTRLTTFGDTAHCYVVYQARFKTPKDLPGQYGLDSFSLMKKDGRWWIVSVTNDIITPDRPLPEDLR